MQKYRSRLGPAINRVVRESARQGGGYLASDTAVDTGEARSNWVMTLDRPFEGIIPPYAPLPKLGIAAMTATRKTEAFGVERNSSIIIRNNVGHIGLIEQGHSPQTPAGLLARGLEIARLACRGIWRVA